MMQFSDEILNSHIAPSVSSFTEASIPDMSGWAAESRHWVENFFLNCVFTARLAVPMNAYAYNFLRRSQAAFLYHDRARQSTVAFLNSGRQSVTHYTEALMNWEIFLSQSYHSYLLLAKAFAGRLFSKGDGSLEQRLNSLYNSMKHVESCIENAQMLQGATVPVWLENTGLKSVDAQMSYEETAEVLKQLSTWADALMNPKTARAAFERLDLRTEQSTSG